MPNALKLGSRIIQSRANGGITTGAMAILLCHQANTDSAITDISGSALGSTAAGGGFVPATHFAGTDGVITLDATGVTDFAQRVPLAQFPYDWNAGDAILMCGRIKLTAGYPVASRPVIAQGGSGTAAQGLRLIMTTTGTLQMAFDGPSTQQFSAATDTACASSGWVHYMYAHWSHTPAAGTLTFGMWINGARAYTAFPKVGSSLTATMTPAEALRIGAYYRAAGPTNLSIGATHSSIHLYRAPAAVAQSTAKMDALAGRLFRSPEMPLSITEWPMV